MLNNGNVWVIQKTIFLLQMESAMTEQKAPRKIVGYWMSEKKSQKLNWIEFVKVCRFKILLLKLFVCMMDF